MMFKRNYDLIAAQRLTNIVDVEKVLQNIRLVTQHVNAIHLVQCAR